VWDEHELDRLGEAPERGVERVDVGSRHHPRDFQRLVFVATDADR
jgi:hypothetical protein